MIQKSDVINADTLYAYSRLNAEVAIQLLEQITSLQRIFSRTGYNPLVLAEIFEIGQTLLEAEKYAHDGNRDLFNH